MRYALSSICVLYLTLWVGCGSSSSSPNTIEWASSAAVASERQPGKHGFGIVISNSASSEIQWLTDNEFDDYKPNYSRDGSKITFFRVFDYGNGSVPTWKSKICVMNADGSGFRELTGGDFSDYVPYWTRDGSDQITFTRFALPFSQSVYRVSPDANAGDEQLLSDPQFFEHGYSSLKDGRMLVRRELPLGYFLLTPNVGGTPTYEELSYPSENTYLHKMTISPSETKVAYMKVADITLEDVFLQQVYYPAVIAYADFDAANLRIENEVEISEYDESAFSWYPSWDPDEKLILWAEGHPCPELSESPCTPTGVIKAYSLETGVTTQISSHDELEYRYPIVVGQTK
jgi:hypothetical protein